jgi:hypothetical protein
MTVGEDPLSTGWINRIPMGAMDGLQIIENFCGEPLDAELAQRLGSAPSDQLIALVEKLSPYWYDWYDDALADDSDGDNFHFMASDHWNADSRIMPAAEYKKLALYYPKIGIPDPLAWTLKSQIDAAALIGAVDTGNLQRNVIEGLAVLAEIAPLVRMGALKLIPHLFASLHPKLQDVARTELEREDPADRIPGTARSFIASEYAVLSAMAGTLGVNPVAGSPRMWNELRKGVDALAKRSDPVSMEVQHAFVNFDVPGVAALPMHDLVALRRDSEAFGEFRLKLASAVTSADQLAHEKQELFELHLHDHLESARARCEHEARTSTALDAFVLPTAAGLTVGAVTIAAKYSLLSKIPEDPSDALIALASVGAPGAAWLLASLARCLLPSRKHAANLARVYGAITEGIRDSK